MTSSSVYSRVIAAAAVAATLAGAAQSARAADIGTNLPSPLARIEAGTLHVDKYGSGTPAVILVPGLTCGPWVWESAINALAASHTVYAVTLPGFDGLPPATPPLLDAADAGLLQLITKEHLDRPVLIGHSLGGFLALRFAEEHSDLLRGAVTVDGWPVFPTYVNMTAEQRKAAARLTAGQVRDYKDFFAMGQQRALMGLITDPQKVSQVASLAAKSDPDATAQYLEEMLQADLRPALGTIKVPVLALAPVPDKVPADWPDYAKAMTPDQLTQAIVQFDGSLMGGATSVTVKPIANARHFAMIDQPEAVNKALTDFLAGLK
ncbi:MAG TPA: alpha/beta hydrolase [Candidatus Tumulicola sp.]|nr:alpha/beta hydrolase [Candidatus Tumulicola sp.]